MRRPIIQTTQGLPRRDFIQRMIGGGVASAVTLMGQRKTFADVPTGKTVVVIFQRGANDGINTFVPYGDPYYKDVHRPGIHIPEPNGSDPTSAWALPGNGFFGLHPRLVAEEQDGTVVIPGSSPTAWFKVPLNGGFKPLFNTGKLAIFPGVNYKGNSLSHFVQQDRIEALPGDNRTLSADGYLNRYLQRYQEAVNLQAANIGSGVIKAMRGAAVVPTFFNLAGYQLYDPSTSPFIDPELQSIVDGNITSSFGQEPPSQKVYGQLVHQFGRKLVGDIALIRQITSDPQIVAANMVDANRLPRPMHDALYPGTLTVISPTVTRITAAAVNPTKPSTTTTLAAQLRDVAHVIKVGRMFPSYNISLRVAAIDHNGGYDTHNQQGRGDTGGTQGRLLYDLSQSINAFLTDLGAFQPDPTKNFAKDVVVIVQTEFGRTVAQNASAGTDHGVGSCWFVAGGGDNFNGGVYYDTSGSGPSQGYSLAPADLDSGRYLPTKVNYKNIIEDLFRGHMGVANPADLSAIVPRKPSEPTEAAYTPTGLFS